LFGVCGLVDAVAFRCDGILFFSFLSTLHVIGYHRSMNRGVAQRIAAVRFTVLGNTAHKVR
jgi:hypothetical protein